MLEPRTLADGEMLFQQGDPGDALFILEEGQIELFVWDHRGQRVVLGTHSDGEIFGELSLLDEGPRTASVVALTDCKLLALSRDHLLNFIEKRPHGALLLLKIVTTRLRNANQMIQSRATKSFNHQIETKLSILQKFAYKGASFAGSFSFLILNAAIFGWWVVANSTSLFSIKQFDPYPYSLLSFVVSIEAIFLSIIVLFAQNLEAATEKIKNDIEYDVNLRAEEELIHLHEKLDSLRSEMLSEISKIKR